MVQTYSENILIGLRVHDENTISERWNAFTGTPEFRRSDTPPQREVIVHMIIGVNTPKNFETYIQNASAVCSFKTTL